jgi:lysophospholipase L1-like esterase
MLSMLARNMRRSLATAAVLLFAWSFALADDPFALAPSRIVILGSSTAAGEAARPLDSSWANKYTAYIKTLYPSCVVTNLAVGGYTTFNVMPTGYVPPAPWNTSGYQPVVTKNITAALSLNPDIIIVNLPTNDCNDLIPIEQQVENYNTILGLAEASNVQFYITTSQPRNSGAAVRSLLMRLRDTTVALYGDHCLDFWTGLADANGNILSQYNYDNTHFNNAGHAVLFERVKSGVLITTTGFSVPLKVFLQGPLSGNTMRTDLLQSGVIPSEQPYSADPWDYAGSESVSALPDQTVDWVLVELRSDSTAGSITGQRAGILLSDGTVVDLDGSSALAFPDVPFGSYYIVIRHRNHLAVMSASRQFLCSSNTLYDFATSTTKMFGGSAYWNGSVAAMFGGDADASGDVGALDRASVWNQRNSTGYMLDDVDLTGDVGALDRAFTWNNRNTHTLVP